jgi:hypothetical protein
MYEDLPSPDLREKAKRNRLERVIGRSGWVLFPLLVLVAWWAIIAYTDSPVFFKFYLCFTALLFVPLLVFWVTTRVADFRNRHYLHELKRRFGRLPIRWYVRYFQDRLRENGIICVFQGAGLPHGGKYWACISFGDEGEAKMSRGVCPTFNLAEDFSSIAQSEEHRIAGEAAASILALIGRTKGIGKCHFTPNVKDGFPATLAVIFGDGTKATVISCNLAGLDVLDRQDDRIKLLALVASVVCHDSSRRFLD